jgi:hypothetical protein
MRLQHASVCINRRRLLLLLNHILALHYRLPFILDHFLTPHLGLPSCVIYILVAPLAQQLACAVSGDHLAILLLLAAPLLQLL